MVQYLFLSLTDMLHMVSSHGGCMAGLAVESAVIPSCAVNKIRNIYSEPDAGFEDVDIDYTEIDQTWRYWWFLSSCIVQIYKTFNQQNELCTGIIKQCKLCTKYISNKSLWIWKMLVCEDHSIIQVLVRVGEKSSWYDSTNREECWCLWNVFV